MAEVDNYGSLVPYDCSEDEDEDEEEEEEEETPQHPIQDTCDTDCIGGRLSSGGVYLPYLRKPKRKITYDVDAVNRYFGLKPFTAAAIADIESAFFDTDDDLLNWEPTHWRVFDNPNRLELYHIIVDPVDKCIESKCLEMLRQIDCEKRFSCCSIEIPNVFFAWLKQEEAEKLRGVKGIADFMMRRKMFVHC